MKVNVARKDRQRPRQLSRDIAICIAADALFPLTGFVIAVYLTRTLGPAQYGLYSMLFTIVLGINFVISSVCRQATISRISLEENWRPAASEAFRIHFILGVIFSTGLFLAAPVFATLLRLPEVTSLLRLYAAEILFFSLVAPHRLTLIARGIFNLRALLGLVYRIGRMLFILVFVAAGLSVEGAILGNIVAVVVELIAARLLAPIPLRLVRRLDAGKLLRFALPLMVYDFCFEVAFRSDLFLLRIFGGEKNELGYYAAAQMVAFIPLFLTISLSAIILSTATRLGREKKTESFRALAQQLMKILFWLFPFCSIIAGSAWSILDTLFGNSYTQAAGILAVLCFLPIPVLIARTAANLLIADNHATVPVRVLLPVLPVLIVLTALLVPRYGAVGVAWSIVTTFTLTAIFFLAILHRLVIVRFDMAGVLKLIVISVAIFSLSARWHTTGPWLVMECVSLAGLIVLALIATGQIGKSERVLLLSIFRNR
jgi:O-antigen/teichoic acid export membrane protein